MSKKKSHSLNYLSFFQQLNDERVQKPGWGISLFFDDELAFSCSACGQCCEQPWGVYISKKYYDTWALPAAQAIHQPVEDLFQVLPSSHNAFAVLKKNPSTQKCVFLAEDKKCLIHLALGESAKPEMCQAYPRLLIRDVEGASLSSYQSPSCYAVARERPQPLQLCYSWHKRSEHTQARFALSAQKSMAQNAFFLWTGFALDVLDKDSALSIGLSTLLSGLQGLVGQNVEHLTTELVLNPLQKALHSHGQNISNPLTVAEYQSLCLALSDMLPAAESLNGFRQWLSKTDPEALAKALSASERTQMLLYQRTYFAKQILTQEYVSGAYINMLQQLYLWCKLAFLQTTLSLFIRETEPDAREYMGKATNLLHSLVIQSPSNLKQWQLHRWPDPVCYLNLYRLIRGLQILGF